MAVLLSGVPDALASALNNDDIGVMRFFPPLPAFAFQAALLSFDDTVLKSVAESYERWRQPDNKPKRGGPRGTSTSKSSKKSKTDKDAAGGTVDNSTAGGNANWWVLLNEEKFKVKMKVWTGCRDMNMKNNLLSVPLSEKAQAKAGRQ